MNTSRWDGSVAAWIGIFLCLMLSISGCAAGSSESTGARGSKDAGKVRVGLLPKIKGISYFSSCYAGALEAADELGSIDLIYDGPTDGDPRKQAEMIEQWMVSGMDVICVAPNAPDVVANAMREARQAGIHVITWDADGVDDARALFVNQASPETIGHGLVRTMIEDLGGPDVEGDVVIISSDATSANQNAWIEVMKPALEATKLTLRTIKYPGENGSQALADAKDVIKKYPNLKGIFGISSVSFPAAAEAVEQSGKVGEIMVTGLGTPNDMKHFVHNGTVKSVVLWNTVDLGYLTIQVAHQLTQGKVPPDAESIVAGRLGEKPIRNQNVLLGDILVFRADNIDQFDF